MEQSASSSCLNSDMTMPPVTIDDLPMEMLLEVFSYLKLKDLVSACCVSSRWKEVGNGAPLMTRQTYTITSYEDLSKIVRTFQSIPNLRNVKIFYSPIVKVESTLLSLLEYCTDTRGIYIDWRVGVDSYVLQNVVKKFTNLESLSVSLRCPAQHVINQIGAGLKIQKLVLFPFTHDIDLKPIADGCPNLRHLEIRNKPIKSDDFTYLLRQKKHLLQSLVFTYMLPYPSIAPPLHECTRLEHVGCKGISPTSLPLGVFLDEISSLSALKRLDLWLEGDNTQDEAMKLSKCSFSSTLTHLNLIIESDVSQDFARNIVYGLPNVEKLRVLIGTEPYEREGLQNLLEMKKLQQLVIQEWPLDGPLFDMLLQCKQIKHLIIASCDELNDQNALRLVEEMTLTYLKITLCRSLTDGFLKSLPRCETLKEFHVDLEDPLEQTVRELKLRQPWTRIIVRKSMDVCREPTFEDL